MATVRRWPARSLIGFVELSKARKVVNSDSSGVQMKNRTEVGTLEQGTARVHPISAAPNQSRWKRFKNSDALYSEIRR
jgi:hypothetical protein